MPLVALLRALVVLVAPFPSAFAAQGRIEGVVRLPDGSPASGATVVVVRDVDDEIDMGLGFAIASRKTRTDARGAFRFERLDARPWKVRATMDAPESGPSSVVRLPLEVEMRGVVVGQSGLVLELDAGSTIQGRVVDDRDEPIAACTVTMRHVTRFEGREPRAWTSRDVSIRTDDGCFTIHGVRGGACLVGVKADGHVDAQDERLDLPGENEPLAFTLPRAARVRGIVVDAAGAPVAGAVVSVRAPGERAPFVEADEFDVLDLVTDGAEDRRAAPGTAVTDASGRFDLGGVKPGSGILRADARGHARSIPRDVELAPAGTLDDVRIALRRGATLRGVVRAPSGDPCKDVDVGVIVDGASLWTTTAPDGSYRLEHVMPGKVVLYVRQEDAPDGAARMNPAIVELDLTLREGDDVDVPIGGKQPEESTRTRVKGTVRGALAVANTNVRFGPSRKGSTYVETRAKADGTYELELAEKGRHWIVLHLPSDSLAERTVSIGDGPEQVVDLELPGTLLRGRVVDETGAPVRARLRARRTDLESSTGGWSTRNADNTAEDGTYVFEGLERGPWRLTVTPKDAGTPFAERHLVVDLARTSKIEGLFVVVAPGGAIEGVVRGPDGRPFAGARVTARGEDGFDHDHETAVEQRVATDAAGRFRITRLSPGSWRVRAVADGLASRESEIVRVESGADARVELALARGGSIEVGLVDAADARVEHGPGPWTRAHDATGVAWNDLETETYGELVRRLGPLPPGRWTVRRGDGVAYPPIEVEVRPDEVASVVLRERK